MTTVKALPTKAVGIHPGAYFTDVLHGWQQHFAAEVAERRHAILQQILGAA